MFKYLPFLKSTRFYAAVLMALAIWFGNYGWLPVELVEFIKLVTGTHIGLRSLDRFSEKLGKK